MFRSRRFLWTAVLLLAALLTGAFLALRFQPFLERQARPWIAARMAEALKAEVTMEGLALQGRQVVIDGLRVDKAGEYRLQVPELTISFGLLDLLRKRVSAIEVRGPDFTLWIEEEGPEEGRREEPGGGADRPPLPDDPPLAIEQWRLRDGNSRLVWGERTITLGRIEAEGGLGREFGIDIRAVLGEEAGGETIELSARGSWEERPELTVTDLLWSGRSLLKEPLTLVPGRGAAEISIGLERLNSTEAGGLLEALEEEPPWPPALTWSVAEPSLTLASAGDGPRLVVGLGPGRLAGVGWDFPWQEAWIQAKREGEAWVLDGTLKLAAEAEIAVKGRLENEELAARLLCTVPAPVGLAEEILLEVPALVERVKEVRIEGALVARAGAIAFDSSTLTATLDSGARLSGLLKVAWNREDGKLLLEGLSLAPPGGSSPLATAGLELDFPPDSTSWQGYWHLATPSLQRLAGELEFSKPATDWDLISVRASGTVSPGGRGIDVAGMELEGALGGEGLSGRLAAELAIRFRVGTELEISSLLLEDLDYLPSEGSAGLTGSRLRMKGTLVLGEERNRFDLQGETAAEEALYGIWYSRLQGMPLRFQVRGGWEGERAQIEHMELDLAGLVRGRGEVEKREESLAFSASLQVPDLDGAFRKALPRLVGGLVEIPESLVLGGGLAVTLNGRKAGDDWRADLVLAAESVDADLGERGLVKGFSGELPLLLSRGLTGDEHPRKARLEWEELSLGPVGGNPGRLELTAGDNHWQLRQPLILALAGGTLTIDSLFLALPAEGPHLEAALKVDAVRLGELSTALGWPEMGGRVSADLGGIRYAGDEFSSDGRVLAKVFGGDLQIRNLRVEAPFSDFPTYYGDLDFAGLDLELLTGTFEFGEINGIADGFVHDLRIFDGLPTSFHARFETREEGERTISVKAIRNLNAFSQGGLSAALSQGIYQFIDFYRYRKIGFECWLRNDVFRLEGTARDDSDRYLVHGSWLPPRIDVVTSATAISFQELVRRLQRIERTGD